MVLNIPLNNSVSTLRCYNLSIICDMKRYLYIRIYPVNLRLYATRVTFDRCTSRDGDVYTYFMTPL